MTYSVLKSYFLLAAVDIVLRTSGFERIYKAVAAWPTKALSEELRAPYDRLSYAMDLACVFYPKTVRCLQRSIAAVLLLRGSGWAAQLVIGCAIGTFENHAWVEVGGVVVNDRPYVNEMYQVLDRC